jgi:hypothetical protein
LGFHFGFWVFFKKFMRLHQKWELGELKKQTWCVAMLVDTPKLAMMKKHNTFFKKQ